MDIKSVRYRRTFANSLLCSCQARPDDGAVVADLADLDAGGLVRAVLSEQTSGG